MQENEKLNAFLQDIRGKRVAVVGLGISNRPAVDFLLDAGAVVTARDRSTDGESAAYARSLAARGCTVRLGEHYLDDLDEAVIFKSPGIRFDLAPFRDAVARGARLTGEMEVFFELCPCPILAVTGSDGKTTTTTLTYRMLAAKCAQDGDGRRVYVGGNIGTPLLGKVSEMTARDYVVLELSSFQLHTMRRSPQRAAVTNVTPNHLNFHTDMHEYVAAKENIFLYQNSEDRLVLNADYLLTREMQKRANGQVIFFSSTQRLHPNDPAHAVLYCENGEIFYETKEGREALLRCDEILLPGRHNIENMMVACALVHGLVPPCVMREVARTFPGVEHRLERVCERGGVVFYNSSIDSSPARTTAALSTFGRNVILILGGYDKNIPFEPLAKPVAEHARAVVLTGATAGKIRTALEGDAGFAASGIPLYDEADFHDAVTRAAALAAPGDCVLLSPACASFDAFPNFEARGHAFVEIARELCK